MVKILRLVNGEDVIAKVTPYKGCQQLLEHPMQIMLTATPTGYGVSVGPWVPPYAKATDKIVIGDDGILCAFDPDPEMENAYNAKTGGIVTPPVGIVLP